ncbi:hypothetical protein SF123566_6688 [Shigella flexneri 1235-66]|nr:hypothetical protein SF123566_6688 [Shigella flexneri 1235-66]
MFFNGNKASVQISIWIILNKCHILTFKHFTVDKNINAINTWGHQVCPIKLANIDSGLMVDFQKRRIEYTDLGHQVLRENQTRPCREANHYSGRHHNTPILIPCLQRHFYRVTD